MTLPCESYFRVTPERVSLIRLSGLGEVSLLNGILNLSQRGIFMRSLGALLHGGFTEGTFCPAQFSRTCVAYTHPRVVDVSAASFLCKNGVLGFAGPSGIPDAGQRLFGVSAG
jgi:hypothetical protein